MLRLCSGVNVNNQRLDTEIGQRHLDSESCPMQAIVRKPNNSCECRRSIVWGGEDESENRTLNTLRCWWW